MKPSDSALPLLMSSKSPVNAPSCCGLVPAERAHLRAVDLVVLRDAVDEPVHEERHRRLVAAAERGDDARLRNAGREVPGEERRLRRVEHDGLDVVGLDRLVDDREREVGVVLRLRQGRLGQLVPDRDDELASGVDRLLHVRREIRLPGRDDRLRLDAELVLGLLQALPARLVERAVLEAAGVRHHAHALVGGGLAAAGLGRGRTARECHGCHDERGPDPESPAHRHPLLPSPVRPARARRSNRRA